jgi:hypothetical protein
MKIQLVLFTEFGQFFGEIFEVDEEQYQNIINFSKNYYETGFEMSLEDGGFAIFSPEMIKKSILKIEKVNVQEEI